jgi:cytochrome b561
MNNDVNPPQPNHVESGWTPPPPPPPSPMQPTPPVQPVFLGHNEASAVADVSVKGQSRAYLVEYALVLIMTGTVLGVITTMLSTILKYSDPSRGHSYFDGYAYKLSVGLIASLIVVIPLLLLLMRRVNKTEIFSTGLKNINWRKGFLGIFLLIVSLYSIGYAVAFMYDLVSYFASFGLGGDSTTFPWRGLLENGLTALLFASTAWLYSYDYREQPQNKPRIAKVHHYGLIALAVLFTVLYFGTAFRQQRGEFIDEAIVNDIQAIQTKVSSYESKKGDLPSSLDDIDLTDKQKSRAKKFNYEYKAKKSGSSYELCAEFKTDASKTDSGSTQNPLEALSSGASYNDTSSSQSDNPSTHGKGRQCFTTQSYGGYDPYSSSPSLLKGGSNSSSSSIDDLQQD